MVAVCSIFKVKAYFEFFTWDFPSKNFEFITQWMIVLWASKSSLQTTQNEERPLYHNFLIKCFVEGICTKKNHFDIKKYDYENN